MLEDNQKVWVPCGKCVFCLQSKRNQWSVRLEEELKVSTSALFVTLTYNERMVPVGSDGLLSLDKRDVQLFMKRLRRNNKEKTLRYYLVGEYGENTNRPHYHALIFNLTPDERVAYDLITKAWKKGLKSIGEVHIGKVTPASIGYVTKYMIQKEQEFKGREPPFSLMSRRPGLGTNYIEKYGEFHKANITRNYHTSETGIKRPLPRFYKDKLYKDESVRKNQALRGRVRSEKQRIKRKKEYEKLKNDKLFERQELEQIFDAERIIKKSMKNRKTN